MKSPRFLAALAMAAVLTTGATAHAASFQQITGSGANSQQPMQEVDSHDPSMPGHPMDQSKSTATGDVEVNGTFTKTVNNFPAPTQQGRYLRVTMPIKMDFAYNVDNSTMTSAQGTITNKSVLATQNVSNPNKMDTEYQKVKMTILGYEDSKNGVSTVDLNKIKFVDYVDQNDTTHIQLPFELRIEASKGQQVDTYTLRRIQDINNGGTNNNPIPEIEIDENSALQLEIDQIQGQSIGNPDLLANGATKTSHNLKLKFEYAGK